MSIFLSPRALLAGKGAVARIPEAMAFINASKPFIVTDQNMVSSGLVDRVTDALTAAGIEHTVFADTTPDPTADDVMAGAAALKASGADSIIAFGGGSPMDAAKAMNIMADAAPGKQVRDFKVPHVLQNTPGMLPLIAVPTTAGTGSDTTRVTVITDTETNEKMLMMGPGAQPFVAVVDSELTHSVPYRTTADTGVDAYTHALEAFVSVKRNAFSDAFATSAMQKIAKSLRLACDEPDNVEAREEMMVASTMAGWAFSNSSVALVHGMSRPIGAHFHVAHGLSNAMLLPAITAFSIPGDPARYADAARITGVATNDDADHAACDKLIDWLVDTNNTLSVPGPEAYGLDKEQWFAKSEVMAEQSLASGSPLNNPVVATVPEMVDLYAKVWNGEV